MLKTVKLNFESLCSEVEVDFEKNYKKYCLLMC